MNIIEEEDKVEQETTADSLKEKNIKGGKPRLKTQTNNVTKSNFKGEDHVFVFNQIHNKKWITSRQKFILRG